MKVVVFSFGKKLNSTKAAPEEKTGTVLDCTLKFEGCGIARPRLIVDYGLETAPYNFNYASIPDFHRYYFIDDWVFREGMWYASLTCDVLASNRSQILSKELYVIRTGVQFSSSIIDTERVATAQRNYQTVVEKFDNVYKPSDGTFVIGITGKTTRNAIGTVQYYALDQNQMFELCSKMLYSTDWLNINWQEAADFISNDIVKCLVNPIQYIISCHWIPWNPTSTTTQTGQLPIGWWSVDIQNAKVIPAGNIISKVYHLDIPIHPQTESIGYWTKLSPYSVYELTLPMVGKVILDPADLVNRTKIDIAYNLDAITGMCTVNVTTAETASIPYSKLLRTFDVDMSVKIPLSQVNSDIVSAGLAIFNGAMDISSTTTGAIGQALSVGGEKGTGLSNITGVVEAVFDNAKTFVNTVGDATQHLVPKVETIGATGSWAKYQLFPHIILTGDFMLMSDLDPMTMGRPLCGVRKLSTLAGFTVCKTGDLGLPLFADEMRMIEHYLTTGFYIE